MRAALVLAAALALVGCSLNPKASGIRPDVILITIDTLRADRIPPYGYAKPAPALESFAKDSVTFEYATSQVPLTLPAHTSILTGLHPMTHGVSENSGFVLRPEYRTLPEALKENGYSTGAFVGAFVLDSRFGLDRGFDTYFDDFPTGTLEDVKLQIQERRADDVLAGARQWLGREPDRPRFAWIHLYDPHAPYEAPPPFDREEDLYDGEVRYVDDCLGRFFDFLRERGSYRDSLVVITSDHGEGLGEHGEETHGMFLYESTLRVPLMIKYPGNLHARSRASFPAQLVDIFPTILSIVGIHDRAAVQGRVLRAGSAAGERRPDIAETMLPYLGYGWSPLRSYSDGTAKFIDAPRPELYDLRRDPNETTNVAPSDEPSAARMRSLLVKSVTRLSDARPAEQSRVDAETSARLRALGYLSSSGTQAARRANDLADPKDKIHLFDGIWRAERQIAGGRAAEAIRELETILAADERIYLAHWLLGLAYYRESRLGEAWKQFDTAAALRPGEAGPFLYAGLSALRLGRFEAARSGMEKALALQPGDGVVLNNLGSLYLHTKDWEKAASIFDQLTTRNPADVAAWSNRGVAFLLKKDFASAGHSFERALQLNPNQSEIHNNVGLVRMEQGEIDGAISSYRQAISLRPGYARAHYNLGLALQKMGLAEEAQREFALARQSGR
jgi:arylsulfatase A-like enzyme/tetratricopeptide (TPR) repeat protein